MKSLPELSGDSITTKGAAKSCATTSRVTLPISVTSVFSSSSSQEMANAKHATRTTIRQRLNLTFIFKFYLTSPNCLEVCTTISTPASAHCKAHLYHTGSNRLHYY